MIDNIKDKGDQGQHYQSEYDELLNHQWAAFWMSFVLHNESQIYCGPTFS